MFILIFFRVFPYLLYFIFRLCMLRKLSKHLRKRR